MRIIHVLHSHGYGGAENHALLMMKAQRAMGHEVRYAGPADSWLAARCREAGLEVFHLGMAGLADVWSMARLRFMSRRWHADVIHGHLVRGSHYAGLAAWGRGGTVAISTAHATTAHRHMGLCRRIIAVSRAVQASLLAHGEQAARVSVVYNGVPDVPSHDRSALRAELGIPDSAFALVNAGRFVPDKGQAVLVEALKHCSDDVRLYLIGDSDTGYGRSVRAMCAGDPRVVFLGYQSDVPRLLGAFDAYALCSHREALGLSLVEAAAASLPSVATDVGGVPEVVLEGKTGYLVPPDDPKATGSRIEQLRLQDAGLRRAMGLAAREHYERYFTLDRMVEQTLSVYRNSLELIA